jgi:hypothetical protein
MGYLILGFVLFIIGLILSFTGIGACLGLPLIVLGLVFQIVGGVKLRQAAMEELKDRYGMALLKGRAKRKGRKSLVLHVERRCQQMPNSALRVGDQMCLKLDVDSAY